MYLEDIYTIGVSLAGLPAINIPCGLSPSHMPIGLQLIAPQKKDGLVMQFAKAFASVTNYHNALPPLVTEV
jgi:aspartyl-tRNA(Asn)/glutamyl-tRNA(Gln) amidotransferase subunit A